MFSQLAFVRFGSRFVTLILWAVRHPVCFDLQLSPPADVSDGDRAAGNKLRR